MSDQDTAASLREILFSLIKGENDKREMSYKAMQKEPFMQKVVEDIKKGEYRAISRGLESPVDNTISGLLSTEFPGNHDLHFLLSNSKVIERHVRAVIERFEGMGCCADKTRAILFRLTKHFLNGSPIFFDPNAEVTFSHPKVVLRTQEDILHFYELVKGVIYARGIGQYADWLVEMEAASSQLAKN